MKSRILVLTPIVGCLFLLLSVMPQPLANSYKHQPGASKALMSRNLRIVSASLPYACEHQDQQVKPGAEPSSKQLSVKLVSAAEPRTVSILGGGETVAGNWLVVVLRVTVPSEGFEVAPPTLSGAGLPSAIEPYGITGDSWPDADKWFLPYGKVPGITENWARLYRLQNGQKGPYDGAGYMTTDRDILFIVTNERRLKFVNSGPVAVILLFDIRGGQGPYVLHLGDASVDVRK